MSNDGHRLVAVALVPAELVAYDAPVQLPVEKLSHRHHQLRR